ncbi:MAG: hypothetical protein RRA35_09340, partial [Desulfomonilia bacterium]|nr:hypothetical protein [Desulfomonilia bacterium]
MRVRIVLYLVCGLALFGCSHTTHTIYHEQAVSPEIHTPEKADQESVQTSWLEDFVIERDEEIS